MKLWIDDTQEAPIGYTRIYSVNDAINFIQRCERNYERFKLLENGSKMWHIEEIAVGHDAGEYFLQGGDYIEVLKWMERTGRNYPIRLLSINSTNRDNMRNIIKTNRWKECKNEIL